MKSQPADPSKPTSATGTLSRKLAVRFRQALVLMFCLAYLGVTALFGGRHLLGDLGSHVASYFFTWDMFPGYTTDTSRRQMIGKTKQGRYVRLLPAANHHFRWGINGEVHRIDVDRSEVNYTPVLKRQVGKYNRQHPGDRVVKVIVVEQYWPSKFNLPDGLYESNYGEPNPRRKYLRIVQSYEVAADETLKAIPAKMANDRKSAKAKE